jgi:transposase-like protein
MITRISLARDLRWQVTCVAFFGPAEACENGVLGETGRMKKARFSEEQMVAILREADQRPIAEVAKKHGVSDQTLYAWRKRFGTLEPADVKRLRQVEQENGRLKKMVADRDLEIDVLKEITRKQW